MLRTTARSVKQALTIASHFRDNSTEKEVGQRRIDQDVAEVHADGEPRAIRLHTTHHDWRHRREWRGQPSGLPPPPPRGLLTRPPPPPPQHQAAPSYEGPNPPPPRLIAPPNRRGARVSPPRG